VTALRRTFDRLRRREQPLLAAPAVDVQEIQVNDEARPLLVFFCSKSSGPARRMESLLAHLARKERARLKVIRVDVEAQPDLADHFRIAAVPTLVLVKRKRVVGRLEGRVSQPRIESMLESHLTSAVAV
jgi:thioredoxin 1